MMPVAVIADVHGNIWALEAVLEDIARRGLKTILNLGDHCYGPLAPGATARTLRAIAAITVRGNQDRQLIEPAPAGVHPTHLFTLSELTPGDLTWIREQPTTARVNGMFLCHGSPSSDTEYLLEEVTPAGVLRRNPGILSVHESVVLCGHTHLPRIVDSAGKLIVNPGSVGLPAYSDDAPYPHCMETGSPHARYAVLDGDRVELIALRYDWQRASDAARAHGREDWAHALATGCG